MPAIESLHSYLIADTLYYDSLTHAPLTDDLYQQLVAGAAGRAPVDRMGIWARCLPTPVSELPEHGWKLHISARPAQIGTVLATVLEVFADEPFSFKCLRSSELAVAQLSRWWARGSAGKAFAVYPRSVEHAHELGERLTKHLTGLEGPHILTDRRFPGSQTVQYRYGTFRRPTAVEADGRTSTAIHGPDGQAWADTRKPVFRMPPWIDEDPFTPETGEAPPRSEFLRRFRVAGALRQSTAGGVYLAKDPDGAEVVLKEARPHTAFTPDGADAVERLHRERDFLERLAGTGIAPEPIQLAQVWEHTFLAQTKIPGITLQVWVARNHPYAQGFSSADQIAAYRDQVTGLMRQLRAALATCLDRGIVYGDVSLTNILIDDDGTLRLVDLEGGRPAGADPSSYPRTVGYAPAEQSAAWRDDEAFLDFAVAAVEASCIANRNVLLALDAATFGRSLRHTAARLEWPIERLSTALAAGAPGFAGDSAPSPSVPDLLAGISEQIRAAATPDRPDRLFPGQPELFSTNPFGVAHGAAGVLRALHLIDGRVDPDHLRWLVSRLDGRPQLPPGLYYGRAGIGMSLYEIGELDRGRDELRTAIDEAARADLPADVATGWSGIGLAALALADREPAWLDEAVRIGDRLANLAEDDGTGLWWRPDAPGTRALGFLHGSSGVASFLTDLAERSGEQRFRTLARRALQFDLSRGRVRPNGGLGFGVSATAVAFEPYFVRGGAGVGMAVARVATGEPALRETLRSMLAGVGLPFSVNPGLFAGMSGIAEFLLDCKAVLPDETDRIDAALGALVDEIVALRYDVPDHPGIGFPGDALARLSCDHAGGSAGIALLLLRIRDGIGTLDVRAGRLAGGADR